MRLIAWYRDMAVYPNWRWSWDEWSKNHLTVDGKKTLCGHAIPSRDTDDCAGLKVTCKVCKGLAKKHHFRQKST